jgi:magnesium transporter
MIRTIAITKDFEILIDLPIESLNDARIAAYWVDFFRPTEDEAKLLASFYHFHPLAIEDCFHFLQRAKLDYYDGYNFFVMHALNQQTLAPEEVDMFLGANYMVTFHFSPVMGIENVWKRATNDVDMWKKGITYLAYHVMDKLVDEYFPVVYQIEDQLNDIENRTNNQSMRRLMDEVFAIRSDLLKLRRTVIPMRDLLYRILNSERLDTAREHKAYFADIYDHLLKLTEMVESNRDLTADIRDSYLSLNSNRMNKIMMTLTVISSIFIPLTFLAGVYGMNFEYMPELTWRYGYFLILGVMVVIGMGMLIWWRRKGWLDDQ